jgi:hypothetical protein
MRPMAAAAAAAAGVGLALTLATAHGPVCAEDSRAQLEQRIRLASRLIDDASTAQRIAGSGHAQAQSYFDIGRLHHAMAEDAMQRGDLGAARRAVDEALRHVGLARRLVPDAPARQAASRRRAEQMQDNLERLTDGWPGRHDRDGVMDGDLHAALGLMATARYFAEAGRHEEAVHTLRTAEHHVLAGMRQVLQSREIDYTQRAGTPEQEFQLELQRHQGLADLVPLAVNELKPRADAAALIERYGETSRTLRVQAQQQAQTGDTAGALAHIHNAILFVQRALQAAGVALPQPVGGRP